MNKSNNLPTVLMQSMKSEYEEEPEYLLKIIKEHLSVVWIKDFVENPDKYKDCKIEAILVFHGQPKVTEDLVNKLPHLKLVANFGAGYNNLDTKMLKLKGIKVSNTPNVLNDACANHALLLILAVARNFTEDIIYCKSSKPFLKNNVCIGVDKKTLGIVGMGNIGFTIAKRAFACGMKILYSGRTKKSYDQTVSAEFYSSLPEMLPLCDYVIVCVSLTPETYQIIGEKELKLMKPSASLINVSRGQTLDTSALANALKNKTIRSAALDVTDPEPLPVGHPLLSMPNCLVTCHTSSATYGAREAMCKLVVDNVVAMNEGKVLPSEIPRY